MMLLILILGVFVFIILPIILIIVLVFLLKKRKRIEAMQAGEELDAKKLQVYLNHEFPIIIEFPFQGKITINQEGFTTQRSLSSWKYEWKNVSNFIVQKTPSLLTLSPIAYTALLPVTLTPRRHTIYFNNKSHLFRDRIIKKITGYTDRLPFQLCNTNTATPLAADQVAELMNHFRKQAIVGMR